MCGVTFPYSFKGLRRRGKAMAVESNGNERGTPRLFALIENSPKTGDSPTIWAWPQITEFLKVASQPVQGPWPAHQEARPNPDADSMPVAVKDKPSK
jgi:hypothetical protein